MNKNNMTEKEMTKEKKSAQETAEKLRQDRFSNLESLLGYAGANYLKTEVPYGKEGADAGNFGFNNFLTSKKANQLREGLYGEKVNRNEEMQQRGYKTISNPEYFVTNHELEVAALGMIEDAQIHLNLKDLGEIVKNIAPELKEKINAIPESINGISYASILEKTYGAKEKKEKYTPTIEEQTFIGYYSAMTQAYKNYAGLAQLTRATGQNYNSTFDSLLENYKKAKEKTSSEESPSSKD